MSGRRRPLYGLLTAVGVSTLGTRMAILAVPWLVLTATGSAALTGVVAFAELGPYVAVQALGGPLVDRVGAKTVSVATDTLACAAFGAVPLLRAADLLPIPALAALVAIGGAARGAGDAARDVLVPGVNELAAAPIERSSSLYDGVYRIGALIGTPVAGVLVTLISAANVLAVDAATFALSAASVAWAVPAAAQPPRRRPPSEDTAGYLASLREGLGYLRRDRLLLGIATVFVASNLIDQAGAAVLFPVWASRVMHSATALGLLGGAYSLGAVAGNVLTTWLGPRLPRRLTFGAGFVLAGAPRYLAVAFLTGIAPVVGAAFVSGLGAGCINPIIGAVEYERVPRHLQARVLGTIGAVAFVGLPFGGLLGGAAVTAVGLRAALVAAALAYGLTSLAPLVLPAWRDMERRPEPSPQPSRVA